MIGISGDFQWRTIAQCVATKIVWISSSEKWDTSPFGAKSIQLAKVNLIGLPTILEESSFTLRQTGSSVLQDQNTHESAW